MLFLLSGLAMRLAVACLSESHARAVIRVTLRLIYASGRAVGTLRDRVNHLSRRCGLSEPFHAPPFRSTEWWRAHQRIRDAKWRVLDAKIYRHLKLGLW